MHKKKVLFTLVDLNIGGVQKTLINILNNINYDKYSIDIMLLKRDNTMMSMLPKEVNILYIDDYLKIKINNSLYNRICKNILINSILKKYKKLNKMQYDIAISFNGFNNYADLISVSVNAKKKIIWVHNDFYSMIKYSNHKKLYRIMYTLMGKKFELFDNIIAVSDDINRTFNLLYGNKYIDKTLTINNCIDYNEILKKSNEKTDVKFGNGFNIVSTGRICKAKNFELLLNIHKRLLQNGFDVKTYIIGEGIDRNSLKNLISINNLKDSFILLGSKKNPYPIMKKADLFVSTSLYESFGNTLLESLILGVPVISTATSGAISINKDIAEKGTCEIANSNEELYNLVENTIKNKKRIKSLDLKEYNKKVMNSIYKLLS